MGKINWDFIKGREGNETKAYIPKDKSGKILGKSGVTIGAGFDLGQQGHLDFLTVDEETKGKLAKYMGKRGDEADALLNSEPLELDEEITSHINNDVKNYKEAQLKKYWEENSETPWEDLSTEQRTVVASVGFQYNFKKTPKFITAATEGRWEDVLGELRNFGDKYESRRNAEADLLEKGLGLSRGIASEGKPEAILNEDISPFDSVGDFIDSIADTVFPTADAADENMEFMTQDQFGNTETITKTPEVTEEPQTAFEEFEQNRASAVAEEFPENPKEVEDISMLGIMNRQFLVDNPLGNVLSRNTEEMIGESFGDYDPDFKPSEDPELIKLSANLDESTVKRFAEVAHNKNHYLELLNEAEGYRQNEEYLAQAFSENPVLTFALGAATEAINPVNYLVPQGTVLKGLGKFSKTAARFGKASKGLTSLQALGRRLVVSGLDTAAEEVINESILTALTPTERENQALSVAMSAAFSTAFSGAMGYAGKLRADAKADVEVSTILGTMTRLSKNVENQIIADKLGKLIDAEDLKLARGETISTALREGLGKVRNNLLDEIKSESIKSRYDMDLKRYKAGEVRRLGLTRSIDQSRVLDEYRTKTNEVLKTRKEAFKNVREEFNKVSEGKPTRKKFRSFKKKYLNRINKEASVKLKEIESNFKTKNEEISTRFQESTENLLQSELPIKEYANVDELRKAYDMEGTEFDFETLKSTINLESPKSIGAKQANTLNKNTGSELPKALDKMSPQMRKVVMDHVTKVNPSKQIVPDVLSKLKIGENLKNNPLFMRWFLNKNALAKSDNKVAAAFYESFAPTYGRTEGKISVFEVKDQITKIYAGEIPRIQKDLVNELSEIDKRFMSYKTLGQIGDTINTLRDFMDDPEAFRLREDISPEELVIYEKYANRLNEVNRRFVERAKKSGLLGTEELEHVDNYIHRSWNNYKAREFKDKFGEEKLVDLIYDSMLSAKKKKGLEIDEIKLQKEARKFTFGLLSVDLEDTAKSKAWGSLIDSLFNEAESKGLSKSEASLIAARKKTVDARKAVKEFGITGARKDLDIQAAIEINGESIKLKDLLNDNFLETQMDYFSNHAGAIALAEGGIKDPEKLLEILDGAVKFEVARGKPEAASFVKNALGQDIGALVGGFRLPDPNESPDTSSLLKLAQKYNFTRLLQYTGVNSLAELSGVPTEFGIGKTMKTIGSVMNNKIANKFAFVKPNEFVKELTEANRMLTGFGNEVLNQQLVIGSKGRALKGSKAQIGERILLDEASRLTRMSGGIERTIREITVNSATMSTFGKIINNDKPSMFFGGLSDTNFVEMGLGRFEGKEFKPNENYKILKSAFELSEVDDNGSLKKLNHEKWNDKQREVYANSITKIVNHHMVDPDSTTSKLWHNSMFGKMINQFRSFEINAASKVAGRAISVVGDAYSNGDYVEFAKLGQKLILSAVFGKLSVISYAAISNIGKEDYDQKVTDAIWNDDAGIANILEPLNRTSTFSAYKPFFEMAGLAQSISTTGRSYKGFSDPVMTSPTGQLLSKGYKVGQEVQQGNYGQAAKDLWKLSPYHRIWGIHVFSNMILEQ